MLKTLDELIPEYGEKNAQCNALKKEVTALNKNIKEVITEAKRTNEDIVSNGWICKLDVTEDSDLDEEKVLALLKKNKIKEVVKRKEYVDFDALEKLMYSGKLDNELIAEIHNTCMKPKVRETLYCKRVKE